jgi:PTH1 family peptidyl-tRNA hydrolase
MSSTGPAFRLIVGLGNPGRDYSGTRHNVGFMVLDRLAAASGARLRADKKWRAEVAETDGVWLCKPQTFMNLSGESIGAFARFHRIGPKKVLVVLDDMALPLGRIRLREHGSAGGHNGLASILDHLGTREVPRLRVGIGPAEPGGATGHVLGRFALDERPLVEQSLDRAAEAVQFAQSHGLPAAMNHFNQITKSAS